MGSQERRARHKEELRGRILDAARELFATEGYEKVSMRRIAEKIEYSPKTIYLYFQDKGEILYYLCEEFLARLMERVEGLGDGSDDPEALIRAGLRAYVEHGLENPNEYRVAYLSDARDYPYRSLAEMPADSISVALQKRMSAILRACMERGVFRTMDVEMASHVLWVGVHGLTCALITDPDYRWVDRAKLIDCTIDTLIRGFQCDSSS